MDSNKVIGLSEIEKMTQDGSFDDFDDFEYNQSTSRAESGIRIGDDESDDENKVTAILYKRASTICLLAVGKKYEVNYILNAFKGPDVELYKSVLQGDEINMPEKDIAGNETLLKKLFDRGEKIDYE